MSSSSSRSSIIEDEQLPADIDCSPQTSPRVRVSPETSPLKEISSSSLEAHDSPHSPLSSETSSGSDAPLNKRRKTYTRRPTVCPTITSGTIDSIEADSSCEEFENPSCSEDHLGLSKENEAAMDLGAVIQGDLSPSGSHESPIGSGNNSREPLPGICESNSSSECDDKGSHSSAEASQSSTIEWEISDETTYGDSDADSLDLDNSEDDVNSLLYEGCKLTRGQAVLNVMNLYFKERWTKRSLDRTLRLVKNMLPQPNELPATTYEMFKYIESLAEVPQEESIKYCRKCQVHLPSGLEKCITCYESDFGQFYVFPVAPQIKYLFEHKNVANIIDSRIISGSSPPETITDIVDSGEYKKVKKALNGKYDVLLMWNTDGVSLSRSSKLELYPLLGVICEVPPQLRAQFIILFGVWCDYMRPNMNLFLKKFSDSLLDIHNNGGVVWTHPQSKKQHVSKVVAPILSADAPAKTIVLNVKQFNAKYGCNICVQKAVKIRPFLPQDDGANHQQPRRKTIRRYVFQEDQDPLRCGEVMNRQGIMAEQKKKSIHGVKGEAVITKIPYLDRGVCTCADYLHLLLLGVVKYFTMLWFFNTKGPWYIGNKMQHINDFIQSSVKVPDYVNRCPRGLNDVKLWKGSEFRSWLLFYSLPVLKEFLPDEYFQHWILIVVGSYSLLTDSISPDDINIAEIMFRCFVRDVGPLYGYEYYTYNVHNLLHLPLLVKRWGPLWATSTFLFENVNGTLRNMLHGTKHLGKELINNVKICLGLQALRNSVSLMSNTSSSFPHSSHGSQILSKCISHNSLTNIEKFTLAAAGFDEAHLYGRAKYNCHTYTTKKYDLKMRRCNSIIKFKSNDFSSSEYGQILLFVETEERIHCLVEIYKVEHSRMFYHFESAYKVKHLIPVSSSENCVLISIDAIVTKLIKVGKYLCLRPQTLMK